MTFVKVNAFVVVVFLAAACSLHAQILNGSFEISATEADFWDPNGQEPDILSTYTASDKDGFPVTIKPVDGQYFVLLQSGGGTPETDYGQLTQIINVNAGEIITGAYFFATIDWMPSWNDTGTISLIRVEDPCFVIALAYKDVNSVVYYGGRPGGCMDGWERFSHTFNSSEAGTYKLVLRVKDAIDHALSSYLAVDALRIVTVPPPLPCGYKLVGDLNRDCKVDFLDFAMLVENWMVDCNAQPNDIACLPPQTH
jgi:hypothetical protein